MKRYPESWAELKADMEDRGVPEPVIQGASIGWALAERSAPGRLSVMATDRADFTAWRASVELMAGSAVSLLCNWSRERRKSWAARRGLD